LLAAAEIQQLTHSSATHRATACEPIPAAAAAAYACLQLLKVLNVEGSNPVVLAGDSHNAWAHELIDSNGSRWGALLLVWSSVVAIVR
jgi:phosphodiesterase/alkaline phosphatase D-like protein